MSEARTFGHYELLELIGRGGMGEVYRAFDREQRRVVALKLLPENTAGNGDFAQRFRRESYVAARLRDPHVIPVHRYGEIDGRLYLDMQLVDGHDLAHIIRRSGPLPPSRAVSILRQAAGALQAAHAENLVHRDVKPSNLLILEDKDDFVYLADFGITYIMCGTAADTSFTATGLTVGTLAYIAPERFSDQADIDGRVDVYSLTCVLYEMLTGQRAFPGQDAPAVIAAHLNAPPPKVTSLRPELASAWDAVIARGLAKDPAVRYSTPNDLAAEAARAAQAPDRIAESSATRPAVRRTNDVRPATLLAPPSATPEQGRSHPAQRTARMGRVIVSVGLVLAAMLGSIVLRANLDNRQVNGQPIAGNGPSTATSSSPAGNDAANDPTNNPAESTDGAAPTSQPSAEGTSLPVANGDLGLSVPLSNPECDGSLAVFVGAAVHPDSYKADVENLLTQFPGSSYLLTEQSCSSLQPRTDAGDLIYAVYFGPYQQLEEACTVQAQAGGDSYLRALDNHTPIGTEINC